MVLELSQNHIFEMSAHAERVYPEECCGLMLGKLDSASAQKQLVELVPVENKWSTDEAADGQFAGSFTGEYTKARRYTIDPVDMLRSQKHARAQGLKIIGIYHSHPDHVAVPSECDRIQAWPEYAYIIVSVQGNEGTPGTAKAVDIQNWALDSNHQFQPEAMKVSPSSARARMPVPA